MKRITFIMLATIFAVAMSAQSVTQKGVVYKYNGKNPKTPLGGVYIKVGNAGNGVISNDDGTFTLVLNNLKKGARIGNVKITKQGMMIFNKQAVDEWTVRKEPLCLILCDSVEFQKQKQNLIAIGERQAKKRHDSKLAELRQQNEAKLLQVNEYYNKLDSLEMEYQNALKYIDKYADAFARIDKSEVDSLGDVDLLSEYADLCIERGLPDEAKAYYQKALDKLRSESNNKDKYNKEAELIKKLEAIK